MRREPKPGASVPLRRVLARTSFLRTARRVAATVFQVAAPQSIAVAVSKAFDGPAVATSTRRVSIVISPPDSKSSPKLFDSSRVASFPGAAGAVRE